MTGEIMKIGLLTVDLPTTPIENLVLEGGGVKGMAYVGALRKLEEAGILSTVKRVGGSSAGGITALFLALGYTAIEIEQEMLEMDFTSFEDKQDPFWSECLGSKGGTIAEKLYRLYKSGDFGLYEGEVFEHFVKTVIAKKIGNPNATFADLKKAKAIDPRIKDLMLTGSNLSKQDIEYFTAETNGDMPLWKAVRITMSFPGAFKVVEYKGNLYVDGGLANNCPIEFYRDEKFYPPFARPTEKGTNPGTLGLKIDSKDEITGVDNSITALADYVKGFKGIMQSDAELLRRYKDQIIQIFDKDVDTLNFSLKGDDGEDLASKLIKSGEATTTKWLNNRGDDTSITVTKENLSRLSIEHRDMVIATIQQKYNNLLLGHDRRSADKTGEIELSKLKGILANVKRWFGDIQDSENYEDNLVKLEERQMEQAIRESLQTPELALSGSESDEALVNVCAEQIDSLNKLMQTLESQEKDFHLHIDVLNEYKDAMATILEHPQLNKLTASLFVTLNKKQQEIIKLEDKTSNKGKQQYIKLLIEHYTILKEYENSINGILLNPGEHETIKNFLDGITASCLATKDPLPTNIYEVLYHVDTQVSEAKELRSEIIAEKEETQQNLADHTKQLAEYSDRETRSKHYRDLLKLHTRLKKEVYDAKAGSILIRVADFLERNSGLLFSAYKFFSKRISPTYKVLLAKRAELKHQQNLIRGADNDYVGKVPGAKRLLTFSRKQEKDTSSGKKPPSPADKPIH